MAAAQTPDAKELALVGKVEMRIALADSEKKLQDLLKVYLAPLLLKLASEHVAVRNKVGAGSRGSRVTCKTRDMHPSSMYTADCRALSRSSPFVSTSIRV